jgi:hypothetical protein
VARWISETCIGSAVSAKTSIMAFGISPIRGDMGVDERGESAHSWSRRLRRRLNRARSAAISFLESAPRRCMAFVESWRRSGPSRSPRDSRSSRCRSIRRWTYLDRVAESEKFDVCLSSRVISALTFARWLQCSERRELVASSTRANG